MKNILKLNLLIFPMITLISCNSSTQNNTIETILKNTLRRK